jgi:hypothetical protein
MVFLLRKVQTEPLPTGAISSRAKGNRSGNERWVHGRSEVDFGAGGVLYICLNLALTMWWTNAQESQSIGKNLLVSGEDGLSVVDEHDWETREYRGNNEDDKGGTSVKKTSKADGKVNGGTSTERSSSRWGRGRMHLVA